MRTAFRDKVRILAIIFFIGMVFLGMITLTAHSSKLQYEINTLNKQIQESERTIRSLEVQIKSASNITNLEARAAELGLVYPGYDKIVYLDNNTAGIDDFALALMETAYENR